jgi:hypothetical protein
MSIFDSSVDVLAAPSWRCPHCRTLQAEASRCWRCARAAVNCSTCHRFRGSVAGGIGYCAVDPSRTPLRGDEVRTCWESAPATPSAPGLFTMLEPTPPTPATPPVSPRRRPAPAPRPPLEEVRAAAWADVPEGELIEAPPVDPRQPVMSEVQRRRRFWRR